MSRLKTRGKKETMNDAANKTAALDPRELSDLSVLTLFTAVYCAGHKHPGREPLEGARGEAVCPECRDFLTYACERRRRCPLKPKPTCKHCPVHCYRPGHRGRVKEIMRYSGKRLILRGRFDLLWHYFF